MKKQRAIKMLRILPIVFIMVAMSVLPSCAKRISYTLEAGEDLPLPHKLIGSENAAYAEDFDKNNLNKPGKYKIKMTDGERDYVLVLKVVDTTAPVVVPKHVYYPAGTKDPMAEHFIASIEEADSYTARFVGELPDISRIGDYDISFEVEDASGNVSEVYTSLLSVIIDSEAPRFVEVPELSAYIGEAVAYRRGLVVKDNCEGEIRIDVDSSEVDTQTVGDYPVRFTATDVSGNVSTAETVIHIYENKVSEDALNEKIDAVISEIITEGMTKEQQLRAVYNYVQSHISYVSVSDKTDEIRAAYDALFVTGQGDCYNYHAASMAFMRRLGIEYKEIQRTPGAADGTHYWTLVNIGTDARPAWYHFDTTRLRADEYSHSGCLLTDKQVNAYNRIREGFRAYDTSAYPKSAANIITPTPSLEKYYY